MCTKGVFSSIFPQDVEQGVPEETDSLRPLLGAGDPNNDNMRNGRQRPPRPQNLTGFVPFDTTRDPLSQFPDSTELTPGSVTSSAATTPSAEGLDARKRTRGYHRLRRLNTELLEAIEQHAIEDVEELLNDGANPNATCCRGLVSACHMAALAGGDALSLLLKFGAEKHRLDKLGRTPLHLAAWAGNARQMAILLDFPEDILSKVETDSMSSDAEDEVRKLCPKTRELANVRSDLGEVKTALPSNWKDNIDHDCKEIEGTLSAIQPGWTPLHVAASRVRHHCTRLLLAAGADPNVCDEMGRTPLDVVGSSFYYDYTFDTQKFIEVIKTLVKAGGTHNTMKSHGLDNLNTPLHTAVELESEDAVEELLNISVSVACKNTSGQTPLHVCIIKELEEILQTLANYVSKDTDPLSATVDVKDGEGHTVLQAAIEAAWVSGVCITMEAGADPSLKANDGDTPLHSAAVLGNVDVLHEILTIANEKCPIDIQNDNGETPFFKAIIHGNLECVKKFLEAGASIKMTLPGDVNVLHIAAQHGHLEILRMLLEFNETTTEAMIDVLTEAAKYGFSPIHFAVFYNHVECVKLLISKNADIRSRTTPSPYKSSTPLHLAVYKNHAEITEAILSYDGTTIHEVNGDGRLPLHTACYHGSRDAITLILRCGADLSRYTDEPIRYRKTAMDLLMNNLSKPTEFMEEVLDSYISTNNQNLQDFNCEIRIDYKILMPTTCETEQMKVIEALMKTGNRYSQKRLLVHPLVESFLYLKWKALLPFFYTIIAVYALFVSSLTIFTISVFFYKDTKETRPIYLEENIWAYIVYATICIILLQELLYMNVKSSRYFLQLETWVKFGSIGLATILPAAVTIASWSEAEWPRHVATLALLLAWLEMMFLLSRFPNWGYYVLMFGKVASNVIKILLTFAFLVVGFSLSFMIQFRSQMPFEGPWAALVKTMVMMTSEFDYEALFDEEHTQDLATSLIVVRVIFLVFLILAAIVLMNLMVGVAVSDITDLEILGNIRRLAKQVEFLGTLDILVYNRIFSKILPKKLNKTIKNKRKVMDVLILCPGKPRWKLTKMIPSHLRDAIYNKAQEQQKQIDHELNLQQFKKRMDEMYDVIVNKEQNKRLEIQGEVRPAKNRMRHEEIIKHFTNLEDGMTEMRDQMNTYVQDSRSPIEVLNVKLDQMSLEMEEIKKFLNRLESKLIIK